MSHKHEDAAYAEKQIGMPNRESPISDEHHTVGAKFENDPNSPFVVPSGNDLHKSLKGRHMQMIAM